MRLPTAMPHGIMQECPAAPPAPPRRPSNRRGLRASSPPPDEVSKAIIEQLQQDGRRSYAAIGAAVGLSEAAVRQRVQRLIRSGVVQIVAVTDPAPGRASPVRR